MTKAQCGSGEVIRAISENVGLDRIHAVERRSRASESTPAPDVRERGGRKLVITPDGETHRPRPRIDSALVKALARAHRWQRLLESGECGSITKLAAEKIDRSYLCRVLRLTLLRRKSSRPSWKGGRRRG